MCDTIRHGVYDDNDGGGGSAVFFSNFTECVPEIKVGNRERIVSCHCAIMYNHTAAVQYAAHATQH